MEGEYTPEEVVLWRTVALPESMLVDAIKAERKLFPHDAAYRGSYSFWIRVQVTFVERPQNILRVGDENEIGRDVVLMVAKSCGMREAPAIEQMLRHPRSFWARAVPKYGVSPLMQREIGTLVAWSSLESRHVLDRAEKEFGIRICAPPGTPIRNVSTLRWFAARLGWTAFETRDAAGAPEVREWIEARMRSALKRAIPELPEHVVDANIYPFL